jgi:putative SOS response-associated peptidase YedK
MILRESGRFTVKATWAELVALYRMTMAAPPHNLRPRYNVCPTDPVDVVSAEEGKRELVPMRWGLIPGWWSKTIKDAKMATFNARAETVEAKPFFRDAFRPPWRSFHSSQSPAAVRSGEPHRGP